jgi:hypothetical protein
MVFLSFYIWVDGVRAETSNDLMFDFWCFTATFSNILATSWRPVLVVEEAGGNHRPWATNW